MNTKIKFNLIIAVSLLFLLCSVYYLLIQDTVLHTSISSIIAYSHKLALQNHVLVLGLIPIYISFMVFGAALLGIYLGTQLQRLLSRKQK